jgi:nicotinate-nucleotide--dimethylbenzimidazole phosphoribosyltransferase
VEACRRGAATIAVLARSVGATFTVIDVGVGEPTGDVRVEAALSPARFDAALAAGAAAVDALDTDLLVLGEIGIGNTTVAAVLAAALLGGDVASWVGRGTGIDDDTLARKVDAVAMACRRLAGLEPLEVLREGGGAELVAIAGAVLAARARSIPVVLDGYAVTTAVLPLELTRAGAAAHCLLGHCSAEPGHRGVASRLGLQPLLTLDLRLGEGSGAAVAVPLVRAACDAVVDVPTFAEWFGPPAR